MTAAIAFPKEVLASLRTLACKRTNEASNNRSLFKHAGACSFYHALRKIEDGELLIGLDGLDGASWGSR